MNGSADEAGEVKVVEVARPEQVREFDAKLVQQLPDLSKEEMQHLMDHREELRARLQYFGLQNIPREYPSSFRRAEDNSRVSWKNFYAEIFGVAPDFSRVHLPESCIYTYTTPVFVAPRLDMLDIFNALERLGMELDSDKNEFAEVHDVGRPKENYIASFSNEIIEAIPESVKDEEHYRGGRMAFREYLLWILYTLYCRKNGVSTSSDLDGVDQSFEMLEPMQFFFGTILGSWVESPRASPCVRFSRNNDATRMTFLSRGFGSFGRCFSSRYRGVRRVKFWKSLPQI